MKIVTKNPVELINIESLSSNDIVLMVSGLGNAISQPLMLEDGKWGVRGIKDNRLFGGTDIGMFHKNNVSFKSFKEVILVFIDMGFTIYTFDNNAEYLRFLLDREGGKL